MNRHVIFICAMIFALVVAVGCKKEEAPGAGDVAIAPPAGGAEPTPGTEDIAPTPPRVILASADGIWTTAVDNPKPLSDQVRKGLAWLVQHQHANGGWAQGEESQAMGNAMDNIKDTPNVADTCVAALALLRSGSTPSKGEYAPQILRALDFVCTEIEASETEPLFITSMRGTRVQSKIGQYVDTFIASVLLAEVRGSMPDETSEKRVCAALDKVVDKIQRHQQADGTWVQQGWAPTLSTGLAVKGLNRAYQSGASVDKNALERTTTNAERALDAGKFGGKDSAGVALYDRSANQSDLQQSSNTDSIRKEEAKKVIETSKDEKEIKSAESSLEKIKEREEILKQSNKDMVERLSDQKFISGFGSNGGEEFLSYLNLAESLVVKGGEDWQKWDETMTRNLNNIQNEDGSWTGHHCITGRTFCTSAALLVLMADRTLVPVAAKIKEKP